MSLRDVAILIGFLGLYWVMIAALTVAVLWVTGLAFESLYADTRTDSDESKSGSVGASERRERRSQRRRLSNGPRRRIASRRGVRPASADQFWL